MEGTSVGFTEATHDNAERHEANVEQIQRALAFQKPSVGRIVHYVLPEGMRNAGECRAALVVRLWGDQTTEPYPIQLAVFIDGDNDRLGTVDRGTGSMSPLYRSSVVYSDEAKSNTWHWPERV